MEKFRLTMEFGVEVYNHLERDCVRLLENRQLMDAVRAAGYQFAIMDPVAMHCYYALPYGADIPYGSLSIAWSALTYRVPRLPSFYTFSRHRSQFFHRATAQFPVRTHGTRDGLTFDNRVHRDLCSGSTGCRLSGIIRRTSLWFYLEDIAVGKPVPMMPNTIAVGDLMAGRKGSELPPELETFILRHVGSRDDTNSSQQRSSRYRRVVRQFSSITCPMTSSEILRGVSATSGRIGSRLEDEETRHLWNGRKASTTASESCRGFLRMICSPILEFVCSLLTPDSTASSNPFITENRLSLSLSASISRTTQKWQVRKGSASEWTSATFDADSLLTPSTPYSPTPSIGREPNERRRLCEIVDKRRPSVFPTQSNT
jgi:hypothetical protein